ncbi:arginase family protein [Nonomuraea longispora]|uniref:Arginase family protein n=2 Tax=Nonomuraea longispora TaxID=1848320 RepID=A0A4R4MKT9_9ACTN|nr:arginase family protein [Nonomuraea longispora]
MEGARLLADMVNADHRVSVDADDDLVETAARVREAVQRVRGGLMVTAGGDCGVELEPVAAARKRFGDRLVVVWFDAHGDLNTPVSSPSGAYHGMVLRALTGEGPEGLVPEVAVRPERIVLAGVRDLDAPEVEFVRTRGIRHVREPDAAALVEAIAACHATPAGTTVTVPHETTGNATPTAHHGASAEVGDGASGAAAVYVHIDLDVLDPQVFASVGCPAPGGLHPDQFLALVGAIAERYEVAGLGITEYEPSGKEDQELLTGLVGQLVDVCSGRRGAGPL